MKLTLHRIHKGADYTIGKLSIDGAYFSDTLEDPVRQLPATCPCTPKGIPCTCREKVYGETAIPAGTYRITLERSPRFGKVLPYLHDVPHFLGVLIHSGNSVKDSSGCILVGRNKIKGQVVESRATMDALMKRLQGQRDITIQIE